MHRNGLKQINLDYYKCHEHTSLNLKNITILAGENAAGKSSVIQSILLHYLSQKRQEKQISTFNIFGNDLGTAQDLVSPSSPINGFTIDMELDDKRIKSNYYIDDADFTVLNIERDSKEYYEGELFYLNAERIGPRLVNQIHSGTTYVGPNGENTIYVINQMDKMLIKNQIGDLPDELNISKIKRFSANCEEWLGTIIPGVKISTEVNAEQGTTSIKYNAGGDSFHGATSTGFGLTYALPIVAQALIASMLDDSILIVENPEAHLHPYSQSMMGKFLAFVSEMGIQVIIETHSEHIINGCRIQLAKDGLNDDGIILFFDKDGSKFMQQEITINNVGELSNWPEKFFDQSQKDLRELLQIKLCQK